MLIQAHLCMPMIKKNILVLGEGSTQSLDNTTITAEDYPINFTESGKIFV